MNALNNETHIPHIIERRSGEKVKKNRYSSDFIKRLEELRALENRRINDFLK